MSKEVIQAYLREPTKLTGIGMALTDLSADKIPRLKMQLADTALILSVDDLTFIVPLSNVKVALLKNESPSQAKSVKPTSGK